MTNVLYIHHSNDLYGADVMLLETLARLDPARYRPIVALPEDARSEGGLAAVLQARGIDYVWLPLAILRRKYLQNWSAFRYLYDFTAAALLIRNLIRSRNIGLVHSNTLAVLAGAVGTRLTKAKHVWHVHEIIRKPTWLRRVFHWSCTRIPDVTLCISSAVLDNILLDEPGYRAKTEIIFNGIDVEKFMPTDTRAAYRRALELPEDSLIVGMVGRINHWKGQKVLIEAAALLRDRFPNCLFLIVGSVFGNQHHLLEELKQQINARELNDRVFILNFRSDVPSLLEAMDIYAHLSIEPEPFGLSIVEAMAAGLPVVATRPGGPSEIVADAVSGILIPPNHPVATAEALAELLSDPVKRDAYGKAGQARAKSLFHVARYAGQVVELYDRLLAPAARPERDR